MLHLHLSNRAETLLAAVAERLGGVRDDPLAFDDVVVPSSAVQRHLTLAVAARHGVAAGLRTQWLAPWLWRQIGRLLPDLHSAPLLDADSSAWRLWQLLGEHAAAGAAAPRLAAWLAAADAATRLQLAQRLATCFEHYASYRPDWLQAWCAGQPAVPGAPADEAWQAALLRQLLVAQRDAADGAEGAEKGGQNSRPDPGVDPGVAALLRLQALDDGALAGLAAAAGVAPRVEVLLLPALAPLHLALLRQLARVVEVHVSVLNPCAEYWFDLLTPRRLAALADAAADRAGRVPDDDAPLHHEVGHPLLAAWGRQTQAHLGLLLAAAGDDGVVDDADYREHPADHLLARLQNSLLTLALPAPGGWALAPDDRSVEIHVCHSLTRELEVLHDRLLGLLDAGNGDGARADGTTALALSDILVLTPDLEAATPLIDAVFGTAAPALRIPYTITGRSLAAVNAPARALLDVLALADSRLPVSALVALLRQGPVARRFGLDDEGLARVQRWLADAGVHWALDAAHQRRLGLPDDGRHTLAAGLERLFLGHALPDAPPPDAPVDDTGTGGPAWPQPFADRLPAGDAEGSAARDLGALWLVAQALERLLAQTAQPLPPARWVALLHETLAAWVLADDGEHDALRELRAAIATLARRWDSAALTEPLPLALVRDALHALLDDAVRGGVPTGAVTFSAFSSLRGLPYRVVCLLGLNGHGEAAFPSATRPDEFDLLAAAPRVGDRQRRDDDRNLFLDLMLAARDVLHLSCTGRSVRDNSALPPSVLVDELLDFLDPLLQGGNARARLVVQQPLQAFDEAAFGSDCDPRLRSRRADLAAALNVARAGRIGSAPGLHRGEAADALARVVADPAAEVASDFRIDLGGAAAADSDHLATAAATPLFRFALPAPGADWHRIEWSPWWACFRQPCRFLLRKRLGLLLQRPDDALDDDEPLVPDGLARHALGERLLPPLLAGADADTVRTLAAAGIEAPAGAFAARWLDAQLTHLSRHAARVRAERRGAALPPHSVSLRLALPGDPLPWTLDATFNALRPSGALLQRHGKLRAVDRLQAWLQHLLLCAQPAAGAAPVTTLLTGDALLRLQPVADPWPRLHALLRCYARALTEPLPFFPEASWAYVQSGDRLAAARTALHRPGGDATDPYVQLALRGRADPLGEADAAQRADFHATAHAVFDGLAEAAAQ